MATPASNRRSKHPKAPRTQLLPFRASHGGRRRGAGRKPNGDRAGVSHDARAALAARFPVHVTVKLREHLPPLRRRDAYAALRAAFAAGCDRNGFRLVHYAVLNDHLHFVVEAQGRTSLSRGVQGLLIRIARTLNRLWQRRGRVFADRYHDHILRSPREVRNALRYVLGNARHHAATGRMVAVPQAIDTFTSAPWFDGFRETIVVLGLEAVVRPVTEAHTWLLTIGWRRHGLLSVAEHPA
ncbi:MAG: transposase [Planctomycetes bacterium]|jgi:REP element-mobilizing transposase RayT|nr:transposase [Planctomycetota bacterium]